MAGRGASAVKAEPKPEPDDNPRDAKRQRQQSGAPRDESLPTIPAHPAELNQVWTNLIDNALDAMPDGGTLTVRTSREDGWALIEICDTGMGVPEEMQQKIFEPFFTTKPVGHGTGLGLDISYRVITQRHGGDLRVKSRPGDTRFQVRLPLTEPPSFG